MEKFQNLLAKASKFLKDTAQQLNITKDAARGNTLGGELLAIHNKINNQSFKKKLGDVVTEYHKFLEAIKKDPGSIDPNIQTIINDKIKNLISDPYANPINGLTEEPQLIKKDRGGEQNNYNDFIDVLYSITEDVNTRYEEMMESYEDQNLKEKNEQILKEREEFGGFDEEPEISDIEKVRRENQLGVGNVQELTPYEALMGKDPGEYGGSLDMGGRSKVKMLDRSLQQIDNQNKRQLYKLKSLEFKAGKDTKGALQIANFLKSLKNSYEKLCNDPVAYLIHLDKASKASLASYHKKQDSAKAGHLEALESLFLKRLRDDIVKKIISSIDTVVKNNKESNPKFKLYLELAKKEKESNDPIESKSYKKEKLELIKDIKYNTPEITKIINHYVSSLNEFEDEREFDLRLDNFLKDNVKEEKKLSEDSRNQLKSNLIKKIRDRALGQRGDLGYIDEEL